MAHDPDEVLDFAAVVTIDTYDARGVQSGDIVFCQRAIADGDPVLAKIGTQLGVMRLRGDWLMPASTHGYEPVPHDGGQILGRVVELKRRVT
jgi:hypothetical protein